MPRLAALTFVAWTCLAASAQASVVEPCARVLALHGARGAKGWERQCLADMAQTGRRPDPRSCREKLARCLRRPITPAF